MKDATNPNGTWFSVMRADESIPAKFAAMATLAKSSTAFRLAGGCSGMTPEQRQAVIAYFVSGMPGYDGVAISGATNSGDGLPMVTNVPAALAKEFGAIALGTCPRTYDMALPDEGSIAVSKYGDTIDRGQHAVAVIQRDATEVLEWDGDLVVYLDFLTGLRDEAGWKIAVIVFNGGAVTRDEFRMALERNIPVIVVKGSGRFADVFATQFDGGNVAEKFDEKTAALASEEATVELARTSGLVHFADFADATTLKALTDEILPVVVTA